MNRHGDGSIRQGMAEPDRKWQNWINEMAGQDRGRQDQIGNAGSRQEMTGPDRRWQDLTGEGKTRQEMT